MTELTDAELWHRVRSGDAESFGDLFRRHGPTIHRFALRRTGHLDQADDVAAVVFLEAWRSRERTELASSSALPWLYGIATNVIRNWRRSRRRHEAALQRIGDLPRATSREVGEQVEAATEARQILEQIPRLPPKEFDVLALSTWEGLSTSEVALALGIPPGTVKSRLNRARNRLAISQPLAPIPQLPPTSKD